MLAMVPCGQRAAGHGTRQTRQTRPDKAWTATGRCAVVGVLACVVERGSRGAICSGPVAALPKRFLGIEALPAHCPVRRVYLPQRARSWIDVATAPLLQPRADCLPKSSWLAARRLHAHKRLLFPSTFSLLPSPLLPFLPAAPFHLAPPTASFLLDHLLFLFLVLLSATPPSDIDTSGDSSDLDTVPDPGTSHCIGNALDPDRFLLNPAFIITQHTRLISPCLSRSPLFRPCVRTQWPLAMPTG